MTANDTRPTPPAESRQGSLAWWVLAILAAIAVACVMAAPSERVGASGVAASDPPTGAEGPASLPASLTEDGAPTSQTASAGVESGARPPQFVVLSFDGAGTVDLWQHWREVANRDHAHFTFFLSGAYLLTPLHATMYHGPRHHPGASDIGNLPTPAGVDPSSYLRDLLGQIGAGYREGNEIGTHFIGHFCSPRPGGVGIWSADDWKSELDQFSGLLAGVNANNGLNPPVTLPFGPSEVVGDRTPCLEGRFDALYPVLAKAGFRYDASQSAREGVWPQRQDGIWRFPLASIPLAGRKVHVLSMDYNLYVNQSGGRDAPPSREKAIEDQAYATFMDYFERSYGGNRAPVSIGAHFARWNDSAYLNALTRFADDVCQRPAVRCVSYRELAGWLDTTGSGQPPAPPSPAFP